MWASIKYYYSILLGQRSIHDPQPWYVQANHQVYTLLLDAFEQENMDIIQRAKIDDQIIFSVMGTEAQILKIRETIPLTSYVRDKTVSVPTGWTGGVGV